MKKLNFLALLFILVNSVFGQSPNKISFEFVTQYLLSGDSSSLKKDLELLGFQKSQYGWSGDSVFQTDTHTVFGHSIETFLQKKPPFIWAADKKRSKGHSKSFWYLFDIKDLHHYLKEALRLVNNDKVHTFIWAYNEKKDHHKEFTILHFNPEPQKNAPLLEYEIIIMGAKALLIAER